MKKFSQSKNKLKYLMIALKHWTTPQRVFRLAHGYEEFHEKDRPIMHDLKEAQLIHSSDHDHSSDHRHKMRHRSGSASSDGSRGSHHHHSSSSDGSHHHHHHHHHHEGPRSSSND